EHAALELRHYPNGGRDEYQLRIEDRIRQRLGGVGDQKQHARCGVYGEAGPHDWEYSFQRSERNRALDSEKAKVNDGIPTHQQCQSKRVKQENEIEGERRVGLAQPCAETAGFDGAQEKRWYSHRNHRFRNPERLATIARSSPGSTGFA